MGKRWIPPSWGVGDEDYGLPEPLAKAPRPRPSVAPPSPASGKGAPFAPSPATARSTPSRPAFVPRSMRGDVEAIDHGAEDASPAASRLGPPVSAPAYAEVELLVPVPKALIPKVIGKGASTLQTIKTATKVRIIDARNQDTDPVQVRVVGTRMSTEAAQEKILEIVGEAMNRFSGAEYVLVTKKHAVLILGERGASVRKLQVDFGVKIDIPCLTEDPTKVFIRGSPEQVAEAKAYIHSGLDQQILAMPEAALAVLQAQGGRVRYIAMQHNMVIACGGDRENAEAPYTVQISGPAEHMDRCVQALLSVLMDASPDFAEQVTYATTSDCPI